MQVAPDVASLLKLSLLSFRCTSAPPVARGALDGEVRFLDGVFYFALVRDFAVPSANDFLIIHGELLPSFQLTQDLEKLLLLVLHFQH